MITRRNADSIGRGGLPPDDTLNQHMQGAGSGGREAGEQARRAHLNVASKFSWHMKFTTCTRASCPALPTPLAASG